MKSEKNGENDSNAVKIWIAVIGGIFVVLAALLALGEPLVERLVDLYIPLVTPVAQGSDDSLSLTNDSSATIPKGGTPTDTHTESSPNTTQPALIPTPEIFIYDNFEDGEIDNTKWGLPPWGNPQNYTPAESESSLNFEIGNDFADWMILDERPIKEAYILISYEPQALTAGAIGFTIGDLDTKRAGLWVADGSQVMVTEDIHNDEAIKLFGIPETCCPSTHLLGVVSDTNQMHFYVDGSLVASQCH